MYKQFFGFKEKPFNLVPNPAFLFLSRSHEEAMAHLNYAISQGDGFVVLTGEVGTGKTTLCRAFLEILNDNMEVAYIFNPKLDSIQLLKTINDEFGISSAADNTKDLIDTLNAFLLEKSIAGKKNILLIDEAQNLSEEVLEQLRLLSNLETTTRKLLQIILVGQPELTAKLSSYGLRQLAQRITLSAHIRALNFRETCDYIRHRMHVASVQAGPRFSPLAFLMIYKYSKGIPRLINIACDRILLTAFVLNRSMITGGVAQKAILELCGREGCVPVFLKRLGRPFLIVAVLMMAGGLVFWELNLRDGLPIATTSINDNAGENFSQGRLRQSGHGLHHNPGAAFDAAAEGRMRRTGNTPGTEMSLRPFLAALESQDSRVLALNRVLQCWHADGGFDPDPLAGIDNDQTYFRLGARYNGLSLLSVENDFNLIVTLNLPAILQFYSPGTTSMVYMALTQGTQDRFILVAGAEGEVMETVPEEMALYWTGMAYVPWKDHLPATTVISHYSSDDAIIALKLLLQDIGFEMAAIDADYDASVEDAVKTVQRNNRIETDGIVGPLTKIVLFNEKKVLRIPHLHSL